MAYANNKRLDGKDFIKQSDNKKGVINYDHGNSDE